MTTSAREMTLREGAEWLGWGRGEAARKRLLRRLLAVERQSGSAVMIRVLNTGSRPSYRVTKGILRRALPQHFDARERVAGIVRDRLRQLEQTIDELARTTRLADDELSARVARCEEFSKRWIMQRYGAHNLPPLTVLPGPDRTAQANSEPVWVRGQQHHGKPNGQGGQGTGSLG